MTSSNGNIFRVTDHLCGEFTGPRWIPHTKARDAELWCVFFYLRLNKRLSKQWWGWWFETLSHPLWRHRYVSIWEWHYSGTNLPFNLKIRRCCLYGSPERLNKTTTLSHIPMLYSKKSSVAGRVMMTSSNGSIFRVTGHLCGEFTGPGEFPTQRPVTRSFDVFFDLGLNKRLSKQSRGWWFETPLRPLRRHRNGNLNLQCRAHSNSSMCCSKSILSIHVKNFKTSIQICNWCAC